MYFGAPLYWRETHKQPKLLIFDGRLIVLLLAVILHVRIWTIFLAVTAMLILFLFERKGVPADSIIRYLRSSLIGKKRTARGILSERCAVDFGYETPDMVKREKAFMAAMIARKKNKKAAPGKAGQKKAGVAAP